MFKTHRNFELTAGVKNNTIAVFVDGPLVSVIYHKTCVFKYNRLTGELTLNNGGWDTVSTRAVLKNALSQIGFTFERNRKKENMILDRDGKLVAHFTGALKIRPAKGLAKYKIELAA
jgi:hypothetical protein